MSGTSSRELARALAVVLACGLGAACTELRARGEFRDADVVDSGPVEDAGDADIDAAADALVDAEPDGPPSLCPPMEEREEVVVPAVISTTTEWTCDFRYVLSGVVYVEPGAELVIGPGTVVQGTTRAAIVVQDGAALRALGTQDDPVVFTSGKPVGERDVLDWGGIYLLGDAPVTGPVGGRAMLEAIPDFTRAGYGGADDEHDCGTLQYVRVEFGGSRVGDGSAADGVTFAGCGTGTTVDFLHVHKYREDGLRFFGGAVGGSHIIVTGAREEGIDWSNGWRGTLQFVVVQMHLGMGGSGAQGENVQGRSSATPPSEPQLWNATFVGASGSEVAFVLERGSLGRFSNVIIFAWNDAAFDVQGSTSAAGATGDMPRLSLESSIVFNVGDGGSAFFEDESGAADDDGGFSEADFFQDPARDNRFGVDPMLPTLPVRLDTPEFQPPAESPAATGGATPPAGLDTSATFIGAIDPGGEDWTVGWTSYALR